MRLLKGIGKWFWRFMIIFSFIVNVILVVVLLVLGIFIFDILDNIASPLVVGLHSSFVGLQDATIDTVIPVRDTIPVQLTVPLNTTTVVVLTEPVPLRVSALIDLPGLNASNVPATVNITLPAGLELPVALNLEVPIDEELDVALDVRAVIPLEDTQLYDVARNLRLLFEPMALALTSPELPHNIGDAIGFGGRILSGDPPNLLDPTGNAYAAQPWPGYSVTAGLAYPFFGFTQPDFVSRPTGIVPLGGIALLDEQIRPEIWAQGGPQAVNAAAVSAMSSQSVPPGTYDGNIDAYAAQAAGGSAQSNGSTGTTPNPPSVGGADGGTTPPTNDVTQPQQPSGIQPTPAP